MTNLACVCVLLKFSIIVLCDQFFVGRLYSRDHYCKFGCETEWCGRVRGAGRGTYLETAQFKDYCIYVPLISFLICQLHLQPVNCVLLVSSGIVGNTLNPFQFKVSYWTVSTDLSDKIFYMFWCVWSCFTDTFFYFISFNFFRQWPCYNCGVKVLYFCLIISTAELYFCFLSLLNN